MHRFRFTLGKKFALLLAVFLALQVLQLGMGLRQVWHVAEEAEHLSGAGKIRPGLLADLARRLLAPGGESSARQKFLDMLAVHDRIHRQLVEEFGGKTRDPEYGELARLTVEAGDAWEGEIRPLLRVMETAQPAAARAALARYEALFPTHAGRIARIVALIEKHMGAEVRAAVRTYGLIFALAMLLAVVAVILVRRQSTLPLHRLIEATRSIAAGAYDRRVTVSSRDEIGELAGTFNRMAEAVGEKTSRIAALNETAVQLTSLHSLHELLDEIMRRGMQLTGAQAACIAFYSQEAQRFGQWITQGLSDHFVENMNFRPGGLADEAFIAGTYILSNDRSETKHKLSRLTHEEGLESFICMPLTSHASRLGVIYFYRKDRDFFLPDEIAILTTFAHLAAGAIESARLQEQLQDLAITDKLTGLRNRRFFDQRLAEEIQRATRYAKPLSLLLLDIDDFKRVNDTYGHAAGDLVLQSLGRSLPGQLRQVDLAARYGGEEFIIILPETDFVGAKLVGERIRRVVADTPVSLSDGRQINVTVSVGVACFPMCGDKAESLIEHADQALYTAKHEGKNRVCLYREILKAQLEQEPGRIVELLNQSLENIQPIVTAISAKAVFFHNHTVLVEQTVKRLADALKLGEEDRETLRLAALLHDIGMVIVPDAVLGKQSALTAEDWTLIRNHSATTAGFLEKVPALRHLAPIVRHHHERYDGGGYPDGLKGEAIPYLARALTVADTYASMVNQWVGHKPKSPAEAKAQLAAAAGTQLDPQIVSVFVRALDGERAAAG